MSADHPIGDPVGGAAYGERNDPISAIVAISSMAGTYASAAAALGATASFGSVIASMGLMQGLTMVGSALSLVGNVTGNKTLSKIGMVAGLAGGIGQFADYAMGTQMGGTLGQLGNKMGLNNIPGLSNVSMGTDALAMSQDQLKSNIGAYGGVTPKGFVEGVSSSGVNAPSAAVSSNAAAAMASGSAPVNAAVAPAGMGTPVETITPSASPTITAPVATPTFETLKNAGSGVLKFTKENPEAASVIAKSVSGLADWMSGKTDAEIAALKSQVGYADARAMQIQQEIEKEKTRRARINEGYATVNTGGLNVNTNALMQSPSIAAPTVALPGQGLINTARIG
jgi:hypothetical protein